MDLKTLLACFMGRHQRHRLTDVKFTTSAQVCEEHGADEAPSPKKPRKKAPKYKCLDRDKRIRIETLRDQGVRPSEIARIIGCARSTISNELKRNSTKTKKGKTRYKAKKADGMARHRAAVKAEGRRKMTPEIWAEVKAKLASPARVARPERADARGGGLPAHRRGAEVQQVGQGQARRGCQHGRVPALPGHGRICRPAGGEPCRRMLLAGARRQHLRGLRASAEVHP